MLCLGVVLVSEEKVVALVASWRKREGKEECLGRTRREEEKGTGTFLR